VANYDATINLRVSGTQAVDGVFRRVEQLESLMRSISSKPLDLSKPFGRGEIADRFGAVTKQLNELKNGFINSERAIEQFNSGSKRTIANARAIADGFKFIATNSDVASNQFREFTLAATQASAAANVLGRQRLRVLNEELTGVNRADKTIGGRGVVASIISSGRDLTNSIAALDAYKNELEDTLKLVEIGSNEFRALEESIAGVEQRLSTARLAGQKSVAPSAAGPATRIDTVAAFEKKAAFAQKVADLEYKQLITGQQIVQAKLKETQQEDLQNRLAQASEALQSNELDLAKRLTTELRNQRIAYERANRAEEALMRPTSMVAGAAESITGRRPGGLAPVPGSPAAIAAAAKAATVATPAPSKATSTINQSIDLQKRYNNLLTSAQILEQKALGYKSKGLQTDQQIAALQNTIQSIRQNGTNVTKQYLDALDNVLNSLRNELRLTKAVADARKAAAAGAAAPQAKDESASNKTAAGGAGFQNALIGGAFPLLFGGGAGAVLGGFAGGFIPGNPMMSIVTSAIGTIFDRIVAGARVAGEAVRTLDTAIQHMADNSLFSSKQTEFLAQKLEEYGRYSLAAQVVQEELNRKIGVDGVASLQRLGDSSSDLTRAWAEFNLQLQTALAGPLAGILDWLAQAVAIVNKGGETGAQVDDLAKRLPPEKAREMRNRLTGELTMGGFGVTANYAKVLAEYEQFAQKKAKTDQKLSNEQLNELISNGEKLYTELADLERELNDKKRQYAEQYFDMNLALTRQQYDLTEKLQRKAFDTQIQALQEELKLLKAQGEIQVQIARNAAEARRLDTAPGSDLETALLSAIDEYGIRRQEIDNESADRERQSKLEMIRFDVENERYKLDVAKSIARTNFDNQTKIARINQEINRQNDAVTRKNYELRAKILRDELANARMQAIFIMEQARALKERGGTTDEMKYYNTLIAGMVKALEETADVQKRATSGELFNIPGALPQMGTLPQLNVDTRGVDAANTSLQQRLAAYQELLSTQGKLTQEETARLQLLSQIEQAYVRPLSDIVKAQKDQLTYQQYYTQEIYKGSITALAEELARIEALFQPALNILDTQIARLQAQQALTSLTEKELEVLKALVQERERLNKAAGAATAGAYEKQDPTNRLQEALVATKGELNDLTDPINQVVAGAKAIGDAFQQAFKGLVSGAMTGQEALASFFKSVGDHFMDMASTMIAKLIEIWILETVLGMISGAAAGGSFKSKSSAAGKATFGGSFKGTGASTFGAGGIRVPGFASGGFVTSPTQAVIGEGGEPEYVIPASKMRAAMGRYAGGARGAAVIPGNGESGGYGGGAGGGSGAIDVRYSIERINNVDYVTAEQFQRGMAEAAQQGAQQGETRALRRLQMSSSTRRKVGV
jgi:hypothetical protein